MKIKPQLRKKVAVDLFDSLKLAVHKAIENNSTISFPYKNCINCQHFREKEELCKEFNAKPPARVIAYGCDQHLDNDDIPF